MQRSDARKAQKAQRRPSQPPRLLAYGPLPPPYAGQPISFELLTNGLKASNAWRVDVVSTTAKRWQPGQITLARLTGTLVTLARTLIHLPRADLFYLTIGGSRAAFFRDATLVWAANLLRKPVVARLDGDVFHELYGRQAPPIRWFVSNTIRRITTFQVLSESIAQRCLMVPGMAERIDVVPDGAEVPSNVKTKTLPGEGPVRLLYLSSLSFEKGYADLIEAAGLLRLRLPQLWFRLDFAGDFVLGKAHFRSLEAARADFSRRIRDAGVQEITTLHGVVTGQAKDRLLRECHLFVLPTYYRYEGTPRSVREALSYAMPVVVTNWAGLPDMVTDGESGMLVPPKDPQALARAIAQAVRTPQAYAMLSRGAQARFQSDFTMEAYLARMAESFRAALPARTRRRAEAGAPRPKP